jgi:predicted nucleic acid-binding protein
LQLRHIEIMDIPQLITVIDRYADHRIDLADACLVWLAGKEGCNQILTTDRRDFDILRTPSGQPFERIWVKP